MKHSWPSSPRVFHVRFHNTCRERRGGRQFTFLQRYRAPAPKEEGTRSCHDSSLGAQLNVQMGDASRDLATRGMQLQRYEWHGLLKVHSDASHLFVILERFMHRK